MFEKTENKQKSGRGWPILKKNILICAGAGYTYKNVKDLNQNFLNNLISNERKKKCFLFDSGKHIIEGEKCRKQTDQMHIFLKN